MIALKQQPASESMVEICRNRISLLNKQVTRSRSSRKNLRCQRRLQEGLEWSGNWKWSVPVCESVSSVENFVSLYISDTSASSISREMSKHMSAHISTSLWTFLILTSLRPLDLGHGSTMGDGVQIIIGYGSLWQFVAVS